MAQAKPFSPRLRAAVRRCLPRTLLAQVALVVIVGMALAQALTYWAIRYERGQTLQTLMLRGVEHDIASSVAILDRLPAHERDAWLGRLERTNYSFALSDAADTTPLAAPTSLASPALSNFVDVISKALQPFPVLAVAQLPGVRERVRLQVRLTDGSDLYVLAQRVPMPVADWVVWLLTGQLVVLAACAALAAKLLTRPLARLADAADQLGPDLQPAMMNEEGPAEVVRAARAFNAMQRRMAGYLNERMQILAAISHDLQTPITRMRLRIDLMDDLPEGDKLRQDLEAMRALVQEGVSYAKTLQSSEEKIRRLDVEALLQSIVNDYTDTGQPVSLTGEAGAPLDTRPNALRRIVANLVDNALKYGNRAAVHVARDGGQLLIDICDEGPGIPPDQLTAVLQPFYRLETSRSRDTGGTGLGLAIAQQLSLSLGGTLSLHNRAEGGLRARLSLPT